MARKHRTSTSGESVRHAGSGRLPSQSEWRFDRLEKSEFERCFEYEIERYTVPRLRRELKRELAALSPRVSVTDDDPWSTSPCKRQLLEEQLRWLEDYQKPWIELTPEERNRIKPKAHKRRARNREPVQDSGRLNHYWRMYGMLVTGREVQRLELLVDWSQSDGRLVESFKKLVQWMRRRRGTRKYLKETRGRRVDSKTQLFALAVWRLLHARFTHRQAWDHLDPLRRAWNIGDRNWRLLGQYSRDIEHLFQGKKPR